MCNVESTCLNREKYIFDRFVESKDKLLVIYATLYCDYSKLSFSTRLRCLSFNIKETGWSTKLTIRYTLKF